jgi:hypothetical protein
MPHMANLHDAYKRLTKNLSTSRPSSRPREASGATHARPRNVTLQKMRFRHQPGRPRRAIPPYGGIE